MADATVTKDHHEYRLGDTTGHCGPEDLAAFWGRPATGEVLSQVGADHRQLPGKGQAVGVSGHGRQSKTGDQAQ